MSKTDGKTPASRGRKKIDEISDQIARYQWIRQITDDAIKERSSVSEFHGLEQELREMQLALIESYNRTKPIKHPRDKGDHREEILRHFLSSHGLIPRKYGVTTNSARIVSASGHISPELDIVFYDNSESIVLKKFSGTLDYLPVESVYGTIQVKSKLTKQELRSGLKNIRDFKSHEPDNVRHRMGGYTVESGLYRRFGILFAYEYELEWRSVCDELRAFAKETDSALLPNAIFILNKGYLFFGDEDKGGVLQRDLGAFENIIVHGRPDHDGNNLLAFYSILMRLLSDTVAGTPSIDAYLRLPLTAGKYSYWYTHGALGETGVCPAHGRFLKTISLSNIERIIAVSQVSEPINWIRALDLAEGKIGDNYEQYEKQPTAVRIYNPDDMSLSSLLRTTEGFLTFESIELDDGTVWLPWHYVDKERLIDRCPKCGKSADRESKSSLTLKRDVMK